MKINTAAIFMGGVLICLSLIVFSEAPRNRFPAASQRTEAVIVSTHIYTAPSRQTSFYYSRGRSGSGIGKGGEMMFQLAYVFNINGTEYHGTDDILTPPSSNKIDIVFNPDNPNQNEIPKIKFKKILAWILLGLGILFVVLFSGMLARQDKDQELAR